MRLPQELAVFCREARIALCLLGSAGYYITQKPVLHKAVWSERRRWRGQPLAGFLPVQALHNREPWCICCLGLMDQHHATLVPWNLTCSDRLFLESLQVFPSQDGPLPTLAVVASDYLQYWFGVVVATLVSTCLHGHSTTVLLVLLYWLSVVLANLETVPVESYYVADCSQ